MIEPFKRPKNIGIENDDKGLYFYIGYNLITVFMLMFSIFFLFNTITFILIIIGLFIKIVWQYYDKFIFYCIAFWLQICIIIIVWFTPKVIFKLFRLLNIFLVNYGAKK
jgi:hypothetical protein